MGPAHKRYWLPLVRLGAFFSAVVVSGNLLFHALRPAVQAEPDALPQKDFLSRKKRKLERHWRTFESFFGGGARSRSAPPRLEEPEGRGGPEPAPAACTTAPAEAPAAGAIRELKPAVLAAIDDLPVLSWSVSSDPPEADLPLLGTPFSGPSMTPELVAECYRRAQPDLLLDVGNAILRGPELLLDGLFSLGSACCPRSGNYVLDEHDDESILSRVLDFHVEEREGSLFGEFFGRLVEREQRFFARFEDSYLSTPDVADGAADVDEDDLVDEQRKILWDVLRKTYLSKYKVKAEERIRDDAFYFNEWRGWDFVLLPPLMAGYVWHRGLDKRFSMGESWLQVSFEPASKWAAGDDLVAGLALDWRPKGFPLGLIVSAGLYDGETKVDFVGIGTSLGAAKKTVYFQRDDGDRRE